MSPHPSQLPWLFSTPLSVPNREWCPPDVPVSLPYDNGRTILDFDTSSPVTRTLDLGDRVDATPSLLSPPPVFLGTGPRGGRETGERSSKNGLTFLFVYFVVQIISRRRVRRLALSFSVSCLDSYW